MRRCSWTLQTKKYIYIRLCAKTFVFASVRTLTLLKHLPRYCRLVGKVIVPLIFETTGRNDFYFKQCWCIEATQMSPNSAPKLCIQHTFSAFQQAYNCNLIFIMNRNVVWSLQNRASHRIREVIGSEYIYIYFFFFFFFTDSASAVWSGRWWSWMHPCSVLKGWNDWCIL